MTIDEFLAEADRVGGFAFPASAATPDGGEYHCAGMTLRDWFAGQALLSLNGGNPNLPGDPAAKDWPLPGELAMRQAKWAYLVAASMLEARK